MVARLALDQLVKVRILPPQPNLIASLFSPQLLDPCSRPTEAAARVLAGQPGTGCGNPQGASKKSPPATAMRRSRPLSIALGAWKSSLQWQTPPSTRSSGSQAGRPFGDAEYASSPSCKLWLLRVVHVRLCEWRAQCTGP